MFTILACVCVYSIVVIKSPLLFNVVVAPVRPVIPYNGGVAVPGGMYVQSPTYQQPPYNYSQAFVYPSYG